jgi:hypothetical protein
MSGPEALIQLSLDRKTGAEPFHVGPQRLQFDVLSFWQWSASDLVSNALRGRLAEFLVAQGLHIAGGVRAEWDAYDLQLENGVTIEVKSAAYLQTWSQPTASTISFGIAPAHAWDAKTNTLAPEARRQAQIYVFALLHHRDKATLDPTDVDQWTFYALPPSVLDARLPQQKTLRLASLLSLNPTQCNFGRLREVVESLSATLVRQVADPGE